MRDRSLWGRQLQRAEREGAERGKSMDLDDGRRRQQRGKVHRGPVITSAVKQSHASCASVMRLLRRCAPRNDNEAGGRRLGAGDEGAQGFRLELDLVEAVLD